MARRRRLAALSVVLGLLLTIASTGTAAGAPLDVDADDPVNLSATRSVPVDTVVARFTDPARGAVPDERALLELAYPDLLDRIVDDSGATYFTDRLVKGVGPATVTAMLVGSDEWRRVEVRRTYEHDAWLDRTPTPGEAGFWSGFIATNGLFVFRSELLGSGEFFESSGGTSATFADALFLAALGRAADPGGRQYVVDRLTAGASRTGVARDILISSEGRARAIVLRYQQLLDRTPAGNEIAVWSPGIVAPGAEPTLVTLAAASPEYLAHRPSDYDADVTVGGDAALQVRLRRQGNDGIAVLARFVPTSIGTLPVVVTLTRTGDDPVDASGSVEVAAPRNERFLAGVFPEPLLLGRAIDNGARTFFIGQTATGGRVPALAIVVGSEEWRRRAVARIYVDYLDRQPASSEAGFWSGFLATRPVVAARIEVLASAEYFDDSGDSNGEFVQAAFAAVLGRPPDPGGLAYWSGRLDSGTPRAVVASELLTSAEARRRLAGQLVSELLDRAATTAERTRLGDRLHVVGEALLIAELLASEEYFTRFPRVGS